MKKKWPFPFTACFSFSSIMAVQQATEVAAKTLDTADFKE